MKTFYLKCLLIIIFIGLGTQSSFSQVKNDFDVRYEADIRGELTFIANNIVNRYIPETTRREWVFRNGRWRRENVTYPAVSPNEPLNLTGSASNYNDSYDMRYIDIDNDASTFSSSSAILEIPDVDCSLVRYAGLYWSAVYVNSDRSTIDDIRFMLPGGSYQDITADEILFDGDGDADFDYYSPYAAYKDVTSMVTSLGNPNGEYFVANVRASTGNNIQGGISGGWKMVVVYENPNLPGSKFITTFDGYAGIASGQSLDIPINGFTTLPAPFPVYANMGVAALEGDNRIGGDALQINANGTFNTLSNGQNPATNFFNSSITIFDNQFTTRNPNSINTLGWDVDLFEVPNGGTANSIIPNGATSAILRATSSQDKYDIFFTSFDVDIIAPNIVLEKRVMTPGGVDITGQGVNLGQTLDYVLTFENIGNDDGLNYSIRDVLPVNVSPPNGRSFFNASDFSFPPGMDMSNVTYDPLIRELTFTIPDNLVNQSDPAYSIRFRVQVAENCFDFVNACSDLIENVAFGTYRGVNNSAMVTDDPSVTDFNTCGFTVPGATNFLLDDLSSCDFERTVELCGANTILNAGDGFDSYIWYRDTNANGEIDASDIEITDGDPDNDPSTIVVTAVGNYIVDKIIPAPCIGFQEIITVEPFGSGNLPNPIIEYFNEVNNDTDPFNNIAGEIVSDCVDGEPLPLIFLCGLNDSQLLQVNIADAQSVSWDILDETTCPTSTGQNCSNKALNCTGWSQVGSGSNYRVDAPGKYRLFVTYQNGCTSRFYFNAFQNNLDFVPVTRDIVCNTNGNITIPLGNGYGYQLIDHDANSILIPFSANNGPSFDFSSGENGSYRVEITPLDASGQPIANACIYSTEVIGILDRDVTYGVNITPESCANLGTINIQINNADAVYDYEIRINDGTNGGLGTLVDSANGETDNSFTFSGLNAGDYIAYVSSADGCAYSENVTIINENDLWLSSRVSQHITCREGNILMDSGGGRTPHTYAIWSYVDESGNTVTSYPTYADIPATNFQTSQIFDILDPGDYTFVVLDRNGCYAESNTVSIEFQPAADFNATIVTDVNCFGESSGRIQYDLVDNNGYTLTFSLFDATDQPLATNGSGNFPNLPSGDYRVVINQRRGSASCDYEENYTIASPPAAVSGSAALVQDLTCLQDGIIEAQNVTGGVAPYEYSIDGINFIPDTTPNANRFENLVDGNYFISIRDANGCVFRTNFVLIERPDPPTDLTITETQITCPNEEVNITVSSIDGTAPYTYEITAPTAILPTSTSGNDANFDNLSPDTYTIRVTDVDGCFYEENYTVSPIVPISASGATVQPITCFGFDDGSIRFDINFRTGQTFSYTVTNPSGTLIQSGTTTALVDNLTGLAPGEYTLNIIEDGTACPYTFTHTLDGPASALIVNSVNVTQPTCISDGDVAIIANGGWGGYTYVLNNPDATGFGTNSTGSFSGLTQTGTYNGTVTDANNCVVPFTFDLYPAIAPVLEITPNQDCFDAAVLLTLTASITSGGNGTYEYSLNGGAFTTNDTFTGLSSGTYTIEVRDGNNCTDTATITVNPELTITASAGSITACGTDTDIDITAAGGDGNYMYAVVADGVTPSASDFTTTNPDTVTGTGDYDVYVRDNGGSTGFCEAMYDIVITQDDPLTISIANTPILCSGDLSTITVTAGGGESPYRYSIDGGVTFQNSNIFNNQTAGNYNIRVRDVNNCEVSQLYSISEPFTLSASAAVTQLVECNPSVGAEVRITNAQGGTPAYTYSFNGGATYTTNPIGFLMPGSHTVYLRDANNCTFPMDVIIEDAPTPPNLALTPSVDYSCDGTGIVTVGTDNPNFDYTFYINGIVNTPPNSNVFTGVPVGTQTIDVEYISSTPPAPSVLLSEDFGTGVPTSITEIDPLFCYEPQDGTPSSCPSFGTDTHIQDGEYSVAHTIVNPYTWLVPNEQSGDPNGRYLAINIGGVAGANGIIYAKRNIEVIPNRDITIALDAFNLKFVGSTGADANLDIQLVNSSGTVIANIPTGNIPKSTDPDIWENYSVVLNPGAESNLDIVIRTIGTATAGNDVVIDNITASQSPEQCVQTVSMDVIVEGGNAIESSITSTLDVSCNGTNTGSITFDVDNFGASGFEYSFTSDFSSLLGSTTVSPQTITGLSAGNYTIYIRDVADPVAGCTLTLTQTLTEPVSVIAAASITQQFTCDNGGATITASASGGTPSYEYQLEDTSGTPINVYQTTPNFSGLLAGDYMVRVRDTNGCEDLIDNPITINAPVIPTFTLTETTCYSGSNDATIQVDVTAGNGNYQFSINGGALVTPSPVNATTYTFTGLSTGTYTIEVSDQFGCDAVPQTVTIEPQVTVTASAGSITACGTDTDIDITAAGGDGNYVYAVVADGVIPSPSDFTTTNPDTVTGTGDYDIYVRDNAGNTGFCEAMYDLIITQDAPVAATPTVVDVTCFGSNDGSISLAASGGEAPYTFSIDAGSTYETTNTFTNLTAGVYSVIVRDVNNCEFPLSVTVNELPELIAEASITQDYTCLQTAEITVGSVTATAGGSGNYQYSLNGGTWTASTTGGTVFTNLVDGTYTVRVRDANNIGCIINLPNISIAPLPMEPTLTNTVTYNCDGSGNIIILPNDPSYTYSINGNTPQTSNVFNNIPVGNHTVTVNYGSDCTVDTTVNVQTGNAFEASITAFENLDCNNDGSGSITFEVDNFGPGGFEYSFDSGFASILGSTTVSPQTISGLSAGTYTIYVRDVDNPIAGCTVALTQNLSEPTVIALSNVATQPSCVDDGAVVITANGGTPGYSYEITQPDTTVLGAQSGNTFTGLTQLGVHTITVTDANGCTQTDTFTLVAPTLPTASIDPASDLCYDSSNPGSSTIIVGATGGTAPFVYRINGGPYRTDNTFVNLTPATYTFEIRDANGCTDNVSFTIEPQLTSNVVLTKDIDCSVSPDAILDVSVAGGYAPFTYEMNFDGTGYTAYAGTFPYTTTSPGTYRFRVTDSRGCTAESNEVVVTPTVNPVATATGTDPTCFGDTNGIVEINIDPNFGVSPYEVSFDGSSFTNQRIYPGLAAGTYSYSVRDSRSCVFTDTVTLTNPALFDATVVATDVSCGASGDIPGSIDITITSGGAPNFTYTLYDNLNNIVSTTGANPIVNTAATSVTFDGLAFGDYYIRILDRNGCEFYQNPVRVLSNPYLSVDAIIPAVSCSTGGTVELLASGGSGNYDFTIFGSGLPPTTEGPGGAGEEVATYEGLNPGQTYIFQVIDTGTNCSSFVEVDIPNLSNIDVVASPIVNDVACFGDTNGSIEFQFEGYDPSVTTINYEIRERLSNTPLGGAYSGSVTGPFGPGPTPAETVSNLSPGDYVLFFREASSPDCTNTFDFRIIEPNPVTLTVVDQNNGYCSEDANVTVIASGGNGSYTYAFVEDGVSPVAGDYLTTNYRELDPLVNTDWDVYVLDGNGCAPATHIDIVVAQDPSPVISATVLNQCAANEGEFTIEVVLDGEGIVPYTLSVNGGTFQSSTLTTLGTTHEFDNLSSGNYTIEVRDFNGCGNSIPLEIFTPANITAEVQAQPTCLGGDGSILITAYGGSGLYEYELFYFGGASVSGRQVTPLFGGLDPGVYTAAIYDTDPRNTGCAALVDIELEVPTAVAFTTSATNASCSGGNDGTITATLDLTMDNPPYTYQLYVDPTPLLPYNAARMVPVSAVQTSNVFNDLTANDDYVVRVFSDRGCLLDRYQPVTEPDAITNVNATVVEFACTAGNNDDNATVTVDGSAIIGGSGNYVIYEFVDDQGTVATADDVTVQSGSSNVLTVTDRTGVSYIINVYDDNGCFGTTTASVAPFDELSNPLATVSNTVTCNPISDGEITLTATTTVGDMSLLEYSIDNGANYQASNVFGGLSVGTYNFLIRHTVTGCIVATSETLVEPNTFTIDVDVLSDVVCFGTATGEVTFELVDATYPGGFDWEVFDTNGTPIDTLDDTSVTGVMNEATNGPTPTLNLGAGEYYVVVTQANNPFCINTRNFNIAGPDADITATTVVTDITCVPGNDGSITITDVQGGWGGYSYYVGTTPPSLPGDFLASATFSGLTVGTYQSWVRDAAGCERLVATDILVDPTPISASLQVNQENCTNLQGEIEVIGVSGGQGSNYTYQLRRDGSDFRAPQNTRVFSGLGAGSYEVVITDQWGCTFTTPAELLYEQMDLTTTVVKPIDCTLTPGGEITVNVTGGSTNLEFTATYPDGTTTVTNTTGIFTNLTQDGTYRFLVADLDTTNPVCERIITQSLAPQVDPIFTETHLDITCFGANNGAITLTQTENGINPLNYTISPVAGTFNPSNATFENLPPNTYSISATGTNGCSTTINGIVIDEPDAITNVNATVVEFACTAGNNDDNATVTVDGSAIIGGSGNYVIYEFVDDQGTVATADDVTVQSGSSNVLTVTDRTGVSYIINVYDDNGCFGTTTASVAPFDELSNPLATVSNTVTCNPISDGEITLTATTTVGDMSLLEYSIDNGANYQASNVFGGLSVGTYNFLIRHTVTGCIVATSETLVEPNTFTIDVDVLSDVVCFGTATGEVTFELVDATYPGGFDWEVFDTNGTPIDTLDDTSVTGVMNEATNGPTPTLNLGAGEYYVVVTQANNPFCINTRNFNIAGPDADITATTVVTDITCVPGNDGSITITDVQGGWGGYSYYVGTTPPSLPGDFLASATFSGLTVGTYQSWVRDAAGCERLVATDILVDPTPISASLQVNQENCTNLQGEIEVIGVSGGQGSNYTYQLRRDGSDFRAPQNTRVFSGLGAGSYEVVITDQWGCTFTTPAELLYEQMDLTTTVVKPIDCTLTPGGEITVNVTGGSTNLEFTATYPDGTTTVTNTTGIFTNLTQDGTYRFLVADLDTTNPVCERIITQSLDAPIAPVLLDAVLENISCFGGNDGTIRAQLDPNTNTNPEYQYELYSISDLVTPIAGPQNNPLFTNLTEGTYQIRVISGRGCEDVKNETLTEPTQLLIDATATEFLCTPNNSVNTATITVSVLDGATTPGVSSGTSPYLYSIDNVNFQSSNVFNISDTGSEQNITVFVTDGEGCPATDTVTIQPINTFTASLGQDIAITCTNDERVTITVTDNGLPHNYNYELLPLGNTSGTLVSTTSTSATFDLNTVGTYTFRVTDLDTGCYVDTQAYSIAPFDFIGVTASAVTPVTCFGDNNGNLTIDITGYTGAYDYEVLDMAGNVIVPATSSDTSVNPRSIGSLTGGNYYVRITETAVPFCSENSNIVTILSPDRPLTAVVTPLTDVTCTNDLGEIRIAPEGGYTPYDVEMTNNITGQTYSAENVQEIVFTGLSAGDFTIQITDNTGCIINRSETLVPATPIVANATPFITDLLCFGDTGAVVSANVTGGGSGTYGYQLNYYDATGTNIVSTTGVQNSPSFNDLGAGFYSVTVVDGWSCDMETNIVEVTQPTEVAAILLRTDPLTCTTGAEFELSATGGSGTYEYSTDNINFIPMTSNPLGLPETGVFQEGTYQYYVRDAINGCDAVVSNAITEDAIVPLEIIVDASAAVLNCTGESTAIIYATATGGLGNYQFELFTDSSLSLASRIAGPQTEGVFRDLSSGTYYVSVTSEDCTTAPEEVVIINPEPLTYTEEVINVSCEGEDNGQITVTLSGGAGEYRYAISPNLNQFDTINTFTDLAPGEYNIIAQDQNGCFEYLTYTITEPTALVVNPTTTPEICIDSQDGSISLEILGGTAPYSTALNSNSDADFVLDRVDFFDMAADNYLIFVRDANGCETNVVVDIAQGVNLNATVVPVYECTGSVPNNYVNITLEDDSVLGDVLYALDDQEFQLNPDFRNSAPGNHTITIAHANGCMQIIDFVIDEFEPLTLVLEQRNLNEITAIGAGGRGEYTYIFDGINNGNNNTFFINRTDNFEVRIIDENGCEAIAFIEMEFIDIELPNFFTPDGDGQNDFWIPRNMEQFPEILIKIFDRYGRVVSEQTPDSEGWDGKYLGSELPTGDYWYVIKLNGERDEREFVGHFTLYR